VLELMVRHNKLTADEAQRARGEPLTLRQARFEIEAPHFVLGPVATEITERFGADALYRQGLEVTTTLDLDLQKLAGESLEKWIREFETPSRGKNGAFYALDPKTGQVLVYIGSRDYFRDDILGRNDNITAINSPGSTLKPFTYMTRSRRAGAPARASSMCPRRSRTRRRARTSRLATQPARTRGSSPPTRRSGIRSTSPP
jgi:membrane peptidoglycan carboxypeptidase